MAVSAPADISVYFSNFTAGSALRAQGPEKMQKTMCIRINADYYHTTRILKKQDMDFFRARCSTTANITYILPEFLLKNVNGGITDLHC